MEDFGRAVALDPEDIDSLRNRAVMYLELGEPDKAVRDYDEVIRLDPDDLSVREERQQAPGGGGGGGGAKPAAGASTSFACPPHRDSGGGKTSNKLGKPEWEIYSNKKALKKTTWLLEEKIAKLRSAKTLYSES